MIKFLGITIGSGLIDIFILFKLFGGNDGPAYVPAEIKFAPKQVNTSVVDAKYEKAQRIRNEVAKRFDGAPDYIIDLAAKIANDDILLISYTDEILSLSTDQVNQGYGHPVYWPNVRNTKQKAVASSPP